MLAYEILGRHCRDRHAHKHNVLTQSIVYRAAAEKQLRIIHRTSYVPVEDRSCVGIKPTFPFRRFCAFKSEGS